MPQLLRNCILRFNLIKILFAFLMKFFDEIVDAGLEIIVVLQIVENLVQLLLVIVKLGVANGFINAFAHLGLKGFEVCQFGILHQNVLQINMADIFGKQRI